MTAQIHDQLLLDEQVLSIVGINGGELFNPSDFGLSPHPASSACRRGYVCQYAVRDARLVLDQLSIHLMSPGGAGPDSLTDLAGPTLNGVSPVFPHQVFPPHNNRYDALNLDMPFTGGLLAGDGFMRELYVHMGFHPAWKYQTVFELIVFNGRVTEIRDVSERLAAIRETMTQSPLRPDPMDEDSDLSAWIASTFKQNYDL